VHTASSSGVGDYHLYHFQFQSVYCRCMIVLDAEQVLDIKEKSKRIFEPATYRILARCAGVSDTLASPQRTKADEAMEIAQHLRLLRWELNFVATAAAAFWHLST
jgi:aerobic-type carbon monoxide dehydrogenase small subunit (CoxS/CutS family)